MGHIRTCTPNAHTHTHTSGEETNESDAEERGESEKKRVESVWNIRKKKTYTALAVMMARISFCFSFDAIVCMRVCVCVYVQVFAIRFGRRPLIYQKKVGQWSTPSHFYSALYRVFSLPLCPSSTFSFLLVSTFFTGVRTCLPLSSSVLLKPCSPHHHHPFCGFIKRRLCGWVCAQSERDCNYHKRRSVSVHAYV